MLKFVTKAISFVLSHSINLVDLLLKLFFVDASQSKKLSAKYMSVVICFDKERRRMKNEKGAAFIGENYAKRIQKMINSLACADDGDGGDGGDGGTFEVHHHYHHHHQQNNKKCGSMPNLI